MLIQRQNVNLRKKCQFKENMSIYKWENAYAEKNMF